MEGDELTPPPSSPYDSITTITPQSCCSFEDDGDLTPQSTATSGNLTAAWFEIEKNKAIRELQQMVNRYNDCYLQLKDAVTAVEMLREENLQLAAKNLQLEFLLEDMERAEVIGVSPAARSVRKGSDLDSSGGSGSGSGSGLSSISGSGSGSGSDGARGLPKSISIRSRGFLAINQPDTGGAHRVRLPLSPALSQVSFESSHVAKKSMRCHRMNWILAFKISFPTPPSNYRYKKSES